MPDPAEPDLVLRNVEVAGRRSDVTIDHGKVLHLTAPGSAPGGATVLDGRGGALLPGLHDHHLHLLATAAAAQSVRCDAARDHVALAALLRAAPGAWVRGVGYHARIAGPLDRGLLDRLVPDRPARIQDSTGALWVLNSPALALVEHTLDHTADVERDQDGRPTGRLWRYDTRLRHALPATELSLDGLGHSLLRQGITGVTDATPELDESGIALLSQARTSGDLPQRIMLLGASDHAVLPPGLTLGPRKLHLRDHDLPEPHELARAIAASHAHGRPVAIHCVTAEALLITVAALDEAGVHPGDRVEHAAVVLPGLAHELARLRVAVVTQPVFLHARGDDYLNEVEPYEQHHLYPYRSLLDAGVRVAASSDAPHAATDPWLSIAVAAERCTSRGAAVSPGERVPRATALAGYLSPAQDPGGPVRRVEPGALADLCLLHLPLAEALADAPANPVRLTLVDGRLHKDG